MTTSAGHTTRGPVKPAAHGTPGNDALLARADDPEFVRFLTGWLGELLGGDVMSVTPVVAGTRASWSVDVRRDGQDVRVIVRQTRDTLQIYGDASRETKIYAALGPTGVPSRRSTASTRSDVSSPPSACRAPTISADSTRPPGRQSVTA